MAKLKPKSSESTNTTITSQKNANYKYFDTFRNVFNGYSTPISEKEIDLICSDLVDWAQGNEKALKVAQFFYGKGIGYRQVNQWAEKHKGLKQALEDAKYIIGIRREMGAITREYEPGMIRTSMIIYDPEWKNIEEYRAELQQKADEKTQQNNIQWVMEKFPDSKIVPPKQKEDNE